MADYEPTWESLDAHPVPDWYQDAKLGIFVHWGVYSVPAWAPVGDYAEWYPYHRYEEGSDTDEYHREQYGAKFEYVDFVEDWHAEEWDPERWASFFDDVGAGYVVLTAEHHDGFPLWDTHYTTYDAAEMGPEHDLVGDLCEAVREQGMRFAGSYHANLNYYQPGFEGPFGHPAYGGRDVDSADPGPEYVDCMNAKHRELIRKYEPDLLWFDVPRVDSEHNRARELIADYYNTAAEQWGKDVLVNDRSATDAGELVCTFVDIVSKNGNLLIDVGPRADGTIPDLQKEPLLGLGDWLDDNGEAIYGTTYWAVAEDDASDVEVRYTWKDDTLYATCLEWPGAELSLSVGDHVDASGIGDAALLATGEALSVSTDGDVTIGLPGDPPVEAPAHSVAIDGVPRGR